MLKRAFKRVGRFVRRNAVNLTIVAVVCAVYACTMVPQIRTVFYQQENKPIYEGADIPYCAIECNVYSGAEYIPEMLDIFAEHGVAITFNLGGMWAEDNPDLVRQIVDAGHELGNHGYSHKAHSSLSFEDNVAEIKKCHEIVYGICGVKMDIFAPPSGDYNETTLKAASSLGYTTVMWSADTIDWRDQDTNLILSRVSDNMEKGGILLMHPTKATLECLDTILDILEQKDLRVVPVGRLVKLSDL